LHRRHGLDDLNLFAVVVDDQMADVADALVAGVLMILVMILSRWARVR
jgi:hypothetical protein